MNKIRTKVSILLTFCLIVTGMVIAMPKVSAATGPAPSDWAFEESSRELNDAIVAEYPALGDANGYVTIPLANAYSGTIYLNDQGITGTINGIENFASLDHLDLRNNNLTGAIPQNIDNLANVRYLYLSFNQLSGNIPSSIGNLPLLRELFLASNQLDGNIPVEIGNLSNLRHLYLHTNQLTGSIPTEIGDCSNLVLLSLGKNQLTGSIPSSIYDLPSLVNLQVNFNIDLIGNPSIEFVSNTTLNYLNIKGTSLIQARPNIPTMQEANGGIFLYDNLASDLLDGSKTTLADGVTQATIDSAQDSADFITDPTEKQQWEDDIALARQMLDAKTTVDGLLNGAGDNLAPGITEADIDDAQDLVTALPDGSLKDELQAKIDTARDMLDAKVKTDGLLTTDGANLKPGVDKGKVDEAQEAVNKLPNGELKSELQAKIDTAKNLLDAEKKVGGLIGPDGKLKPGIDKGKIDEAQAAVNKLPDGDTKTRLQKMVDEAYKLLNAKNTGTTGTDNKTPAGKEVNGKPGKVETSMTTVGSVNTGDNVNPMIYIILLASCLAVILLVTRRKIKS